MSTGEYHPLLTNPTALVPLFALPGAAWSPKELGEIKVFDQDKSGESRSLPRRPVSPTAGETHSSLAPPGNPAETHTTWYLSSRSGLEISPVNREGDQHPQQGNHERDPQDHDLAPRVFTPLKTTWTGVSSLAHEPVLVVHFVHDSVYEPIKRGMVSHPIRTFSPGRRRPDSERSERRMLPE